MSTKPQAKILPFDYSRSGTYNYSTDFVFNGDHRGRLSREKAAGKTKKKVDTQVRNTEYHRKHTKL